MSMGWDVVTLWHAEGGGRWLRSVFSGVRVEESSGDSPSEVGPTAEREMRVWFFGRTGVSRGDCVASGARSEEEPPEDALTVRKVQEWSVARGYHHTEAVAR